MSWITVSLPDGIGVYETWEGSILEKEENMKRGEILDSVKRTITQDRNNRHGEPENSFPQIAERWSAYLAQRFGVMPETVSLWPSDVAEMMALFKDVRFHMQPENPDNKHDQIGYLAIAAELRAAEMTATGNNSNSAPSSVPVGYFPKPEKKPVLMTLLGYPITQIINSTGDAFPEGCEQGEYLAVKRGDTDYSIFKFVKEYGVWDYITECYVPASRIYSDHLCSCLVSQTKDGKFEPLFPKKFKPNPSYNFFPRNAFDGDMIAAEVLMGPGTSNLQTKFFRYVSEGDEWVEIRSQPATT